MTAFASGLGGEGTETFAQLLLKDPTVKDNPVVITQVSSYVPLASVWFYKKRSVTLACLSSSVCAVREVNQNPDMHFLLCSSVGAQQSIHSQHVEVMSMRCSYCWINIFCLWCLCLRENCQSFGCIAAIFFTHMGILQILVKRWTWEALFFIPSYCEQGGFWRSRKMCIYEEVCRGPVVLQGLMFLLL